MDTSVPMRGPQKRPKDVSSGHSEDDGGRETPRDEGWEKRKKKNKKQRRRLSGRGDVVGPQPSTSETVSGSRYSPLAMGSELGYPSSESEEDLDP